ncbi:MAG: hypothetical protein H6555_12715 [Lewinellaceae bacterium]|nr:hypothetical protein [Lewinellaceae bacterium]
MNFIDRLGNGWRMGLSSLEVVRENPKLLLFPALSGVAMVLILASFAGGILTLMGINPGFMDQAIGRLEQYGDVLGYIVAFAFYFLSFFIVIFFNVALVHQVKEVFAGREADIMEGLRFSGSRLTAILGWTLLASTVGVIMQAVRERGGIIGNILGSILGFAWSIATYFVVPVIAYEDLGPIDTLKKSASLIKDKWGEALGAGFSFALFSILSVILAVLAGILVGYFNAIAGILTAVAVYALGVVTISAIKQVFLAAAYSHLHGEELVAFDSDTLDHMFVRK